MAKAKTKTTKTKKSQRKAKLETAADVATDFMAGMAADKEIDLPLRTLSDGAYTSRIRGVLSTNAATLDAAIGRGGFPLGRLSMLHGKEGSGKTTLAIHLCVEAQRRGGIACYLDKEHKLDPDYAVNLGVDKKRFMMPPTPTLESAIKVIKAIIRRAREIRKKTKRIVPITIVLDSLNAFKAFETLETETGKKRYPAEARIWSEELPTIVEDLATEHVALVFVSQVRKKMNVMFGSDEEIAGGNAPRFYASLIVYIARIGTEKDGGATKVASKIECECKKNQISPPFKKSRFSIYWNGGIDYEESLLMQLEEMGVVKKSKGKVEINKRPIGTSYRDAARRLRKKPELNAKLKALFYRKMGWELPSA